MQRLVVPIINYIYRVNDMIDYLTHTMGKPDLIVNNPKQSDFIGKKGIIVVKGHGWSNARGHVNIMEWQYLFRSVPLIK